VDVNLAVTLAAATTTLPLSCTTTVSLQVLLDEPEVVPVMLRM
jgi:hypothetical protein